MRTHEVLVVGGGAAGCYAALLLKEAGCDVAIMEAQDRILKKILVTGNGRCNISNHSLLDPKDLSAYYSCQDPLFEWDPLQRHTAMDASAYFQRLGLPLVELEDGKLYPKSLQASAVSDLLRLRLKELDVPIYLNCRVESLTPQKDFWVLTTRYDAYKAKRVLAAPGGMAMPVTGSDGSCFKILKQLGHTVMPPLPALVQLKTDHPARRSISGVKKDAQVCLWSGDTLLHEEQGEVLFTDYGLSGPPILQLSRWISLRLAEEGPQKITLNLFPESSKEELLQLLTLLTQRFSERPALELFTGLLHKKLLPPLLREAGLEKMNQPVPREFAPLFADLLMAWPMTVTDTLGFGQAQATLGGIALNEVAHQTLESKRCAGLYFAGEVLDVCGACGGYNLQWAWSSAYAAAQAIAASL
ncbi:NAD(FAD)-utilizing dehydrogenase [Clostridiaceae bacterium JG1575]|nr:NAD(FAD)-utilizing dehydrogenase [Clostridiaceae bacterium JG1575]